MDYTISHLDDVLYETRQPGEGISIRYLSADSYSKLSALPAISCYQALWMLYNSKYDTSVPQSITMNSVVNKIEMVYKENSKEVDMRKLIPIEEKLNTLFNKSLIPSPTKLQYPIEEKFKDNKYNINKYKNNNKKGYCNYEQRDYDKEGFDWNSLYANNNFT